MSGNSTVATTNLQLFDADEVRRTLQLLMAPGQVTELRILDAVTNADCWPRTASGYFDDPEKLLAALKVVRAAMGLYIIPNPINPALLARAANRIRKADKGGTTGDGDIVSRRWLLVDCDPVRPSGISSTNSERKAALKRCREIQNALRYNFGWPEPVAADSGNGSHLDYRIDLPVDDSGLLQRCLVALAAQFDDDEVKVDTGVFNPARIWKLYGTLAAKGDSTEDRPHRMSRILSAPEPLVVVTREQLEALANEAPAAASHEANGVHVNSAGFDVDAFLQRHGFEAKGPDPYQGGRKWTFRTSPMCEHHGDGPYLIQFASGALSAGCHHNSCSWTWHDLRAKHEQKRNYADNWPRDKAAGKANIRDIANEKPSIVFTRITSTELASGNYEVEFAIEGAMVLGQPLTIGGPMKVLKTSILIDSAVSLASGGYFLGRLKVNGPRRVLVMSGESGLATIQETAKRISDAAGVRLTDLENLFWSPDLPKFHRPDHLEALESMLTADAIEVLFCDPAYLAMPSVDAGNLMAQGELLRSISDLCRRLGVSLVLCHHTKRNIGQDAYEPLELQHLAWAGHAEFARQWWLLNRRERYELGSGEHRLWLSIGGSAGHSSLWAADINEGTLADAGGRFWDVQLTDAAGAREATAERKQQATAEQTQQQQEADRKTICDAVASLPNYTGTKTDIKDATPLNESRFRPAFASLVRDKIVLSTRITKGNNRTYDAYKLE